MIGDEEIITTLNHPFYVSGEGFVEAGELEVGDKIETADGETLVISAIEYEHLETPVKIYNFEVADWHTYYVSTEEVLVHNSCKKKGGAGQGGKYTGTGEYGDVGGHHVHAKAGFKGDSSCYDPDKGFSISQQFMRDNNLNHSDMTNMQRKLFKELNESGRPNTLEEHTRIAREVLRAGGAADDMIDDLIEMSLENLSTQGVSKPTRIPWYTK